VRNAGAIRITEGHREGEEGISDAVQERNLESRILVRGVKKI
jgi:hypothetical protein